MSVELSKEFSNKMKFRQKCAEEFMSGHRWGQREAPAKGLPEAGKRAGSRAYLQLVEKQQIKLSEKGNFLEEKKMAKIGYTGFRFRRIRGGTPDRTLALSLRGQGGVRLPVGEGKYAMMTEKDAALSVAERARLVELRKAVQIVEIEAASQVASLDKPKIELSEMIDHPDLPFKVAKGVVEGSKVNGQARAEEMNEQHGSKLRIPTEAELLKLNEVLGDRLEGTEYWTWTETEHEDHPGEFVLRHLDFDNRNYYPPEYNYSTHYLFNAVRFVEDK